LHELGVAEARKTALAGKRREERINEAGQLGDARANDERQPGSDHLPYALGCEARAERNASQQPPARRQLDGDLQDAPCHRAPGERERHAVEPLAFQPRGRPDHRRDPGNVPQRWCGIWEKKAAMGVEYAEAPRRDDHEAGHREQNPYEDGRELAPRPVEALRDGGGDRGRKRDSHHRQDAAREQQQPEDRAG